MRDVGKRRRKGLLRRGDCVEPGLGDVVFVWVGGGRWSAEGRENQCRGHLGGWVMRRRFGTHEGMDDGETSNGYGWCAMAVIHSGVGLRDLPSGELSSLERHCVLLVSQVSDHAETYRRT